MIKEILIKEQTTVYRFLDGSWHCQHPNQDTETELVYAPTQIQIDLGTDQDEEVTVTKCIDCGEILDA